MEKQTSRIVGGGRIGVDPGTFFARSLLRTQEHHGMKKCGHVGLGMTAAQNSQLQPSLYWHPCWKCQSSPLFGGSFAGNLPMTFRDRYTQISGRRMNPKHDVAWKKSPS
jgi:hypothetical protein